MHPIVLEKWRGFNTPLEGLIPYMYQDIKGLITIGMGNLIDPVSTAIGLPFKKRHKAGVTNPGAPATREEIEAEWALIKGKPELAKKGYRACNALCMLEIDEPGIDKLIRKRLAANDAYLKKAFDQLETWPADAQMALHSMSWAMGPAFSKKWVGFSKACRAMDFVAAGENCRMKEAGNPGIIPRNKANKTLFNNADAVLAGEADGFYQRDVLYYPTIALRPIFV